LARADAPRVADVVAAGDADPARAPLSPESIAKLQKVDDLIQAAVLSKEWGPQQVTDFRTLTRGFSARERFEAVRRLSIEINAGHLHVTAHGFPM
jgi:hypothetical protein